ncbi:uncharacterized protein BX664DRAFT_326698 [Halteromyces radiatus]|uniref:uncharacterized protein n=1 Tax=Halteromyces radiatus TaxID=101107 RepID=UPI00221F0C55|nr:uncharacterized protein BX664DRAFT_326698 [Halteromyces radiatus]KAI8097565.1 hypothetical protein BX664DRAFT_326698 [Halteromyces radiatus]
MYEGKKDKTKDYHLQLHMAATNGNVGLVKFALDHGAPIDSVVNGFLPLQLACISDNNIAVVQYLIDRGAQVNAQRWSKKHSADKSQAVAGAIGSTALHVACANGCSKIVDLLLRNDARVDLKDKYGSRPMDIAAAKHHMEIVKLLETFGALQQRESTYQGRHSMDVIYSSSSSSSKKSHQLDPNNSASSSSSLDDRAERMRRPSLPSVFEGKSHISKRKISSPALDIPPLSTLPPVPNNRLDQHTPTMDIIGQKPSHPKVPELSSSKSSDGTTIVSTPPSSLSQNSNHVLSNGKPDWYSYGVLHHDGNENYLSSLERRAYGLDDLPTRQSLDQVRPSRLSLDTWTDSHASSVPTHHALSTSNNARPSLKRCSSDGGHLRTTALMNAMAAKKTSPMMDPIPPLPHLNEPVESRPSTDELYETDALRQFEEKEMKKAWWSAFGGRKSMDVATYQRHHMDTTSSYRPSLDFRPSFDGRQQQWQHTTNATGEDVDMNFDEDEYDDDEQHQHRQRKPGFFTRWVGSWNKK